MVRGNWQKRVERTVKRRKEAKHKKGAKQKKAIYKALVQNQLWPLLDQIQIEHIRNENAPMEKLHLWVDHAPSSQCHSNNNASDKFSTGDNYSDDEGGNGNSKSKSKKGKRDKGGKKSHPRSHEQNADDENGGDQEDEPLLSRQYFFLGKCQGLKKSGGGGGGKGGSSKLCRPHVHYSSKKQMTIFEALAPKKNHSQSTRRRHRSNSKIDEVEPSSSPTLMSPTYTYDNQTREKVLQRASHAAALAQLLLDDVNANADDVQVVDTPAFKEGMDGIEMLYHMEVPLLVAEGEELSVPAILSKALGSENVPMGSIAYVSFRKVLVFDRHDNGIILDAETQEALFGNSSSSSENESGVKSDHSINIPISNFPGIVMEHILTFLPDVYCGILPCICKNFQQEIGTNSPGLWKSILNRHNWPMPTEEDELTKSYEIISPTLLHKECFQSHYKVCRRIESLVNGLRHLSLNDESISHDVKGASDPIGHDSTIYSFSDNHDGSGGGPTNCSQMLLWNHNSIIAACREECTLRIYEVVKQESTNQCKQILCTRVAPVPNSKRTKCYLDSIEMDDKYVICFFRVDDRDVLTSIKKEDLLSNSTENCIECNDDSNLLHSIDLTTIFRDLYERSEEKSQFGFDDRWNMREEEMHNFFVFKTEQGGIKACGNGIFVTMVNLFGDDEYLSSGLLSFSASRGKAAIAFLKLPRIHEFRGDLLLSTNYHHKKRSEPTLVICKKAETSSLFAVEIDRRGQITTKSLLNRNGNGTDALTKSLQLSDRGFSLDSNYDSHVDVAISRSNIYVSCLVSNMGEDKHAAISVFERNDLILNPEWVWPTVIIMRRSCNKILALQCFDDTYIMMVCESGGSLSEEEFDGHWFGEEDGKRWDFILVHVPSRREIHCISLQVPDKAEFPAPFLDSSQSCKAFAGLIQGLGFCISSEDLIYMKCSDNVEISEKTPKTKKTKKKKRLAAKLGSGGKKDGFARGMSMRG